MSKKVTQSLFLQKNTFTLLTTVALRFIVVSTMQHTLTEDDMETYEIDNDETREFDDNEDGSYYDADGNAY